MAIVKMMLAQGADHRSELIRPPLLVAIVAEFAGQDLEQAEMLERMLRLKLDPNVTDQHGEPLLHRAARSGTGDNFHACRLVETILRHSGVGINATDAAGYTALFYATKSRPRMVKACC